MKATIRALIGVAASILLLWWALHDVSAAEVLSELRHADPLLFALAVVVTTLGFPIRAMRWRALLISAAGEVPFSPRFTATTIGFAANNLLPARLGEVARALCLGRLAGVPVAAAFGSLVVERLLDAVVLVALLFISMAAPGFPELRDIGGVDARTAAAVIAAVSVIGGMALFALAVAPAALMRIVERFLPGAIRQRILDAMGSFAAGLGALSNPRLFLISLAWAVGQWLFLALSFLLAFRAFGITQVPFAGAVFLQSLIALAVAIPSAPGFFGPFEAAAKLGLALWGVPAGQAVSFAVGFHLGGFIPVTLLGVYYVSRLGLSWQELKTPPAPAT